MVAILIVLCHNALMDLDPAIAANRNRRALGIKFGLLGLVAAYCYAESGATPDGIANSPAVSSIASETLARSSVSFDILQGDKAAGSCSGTAVRIQTRQKTSATFILTAAHCFEGLSVRPGQQDSELTQISSDHIIRVLPVDDRSEPPLELHSPSVAYLDRHAGNPDIAAIAVGPKALRHHQIKPIDVSADIPLIARGDRLFSVRNAVSSDTFVAPTVKIGDTANASLGITMYAKSADSVAPCTSGSSGSGVVDNEGHLVGVMSQGEGLPPFGTLGRTVQALRYHMQISNTGMCLVAQPTIVNIEQVATAATMAVLE